jgi:hypothetical protein
LCKSRGWGAHRIQSRLKLRGLRDAPSGGNARHYRNPQSEVSGFHKVLIVYQSFIPSLAGRVVQLSATFAGIAMPSKTQRKQGQFRAKSLIDL